MIRVKILVELLESVEFVIVKLNIWLSKRFELLKVLPRHKFPVFDLVVERLEETVFFVLDYLTVRFGVSTMPKLDRLTVGMFVKDSNRLVQMTFGGSTIFIKPCIVLWFGW